jgi:hypothetical protein
MWLLAGLPLLWSGSSLSTLVSHPPTSFSINLYILTAKGYSWGPCAWIIVAEIWPLSNRPYGIALGASSNWSLSPFTLQKI